MGGRRSVSRERALGPSPAQARRDERAAMEIEPQIPSLKAPSLVSWRPSARLVPVERYGRFEILGRIGRGGMAEILLARERSLAGGSRHLVIKRVLPEVRDFDEMLHMFLDEARVVMDLSHPNLCQIYEIGEQDGTWFIAMEWVNGVTLHQLARRAVEQKCVDYGVIARVFAQCAEALHYAHTARDAEGQLINLVHRDVSPHNVMIAYDGRVKLLDFGIAKSSATTHRTEAGVVKGKICYMAPEQWLSLALDARTDVFALGASLYEGLSGKVALRRENQAEVMKAALAGDIPKLSSVAPNVPAALVEIVERALQTEPERRFQSARQMSEALERFLSTLAEPVSTGRIADYTRKAFQGEVQLGPVLERSLRGANVEQGEGLFLPPLPASLMKLAHTNNNRLPIPAPFSFAPQGSMPDLRPWPEEGAFDREHATESARAGSGHSEPVGGYANRPSVQEELEAGEYVEETPSEAPTRPTNPSLTQLTAVADTPRPLARTLSLRVGRGTRYALIACTLAIAAAVPAFYAARTALPQPSAQLPLQTLHEASTHVGAAPAPVFTLLPAGAPMTQSPSSSTRPSPSPEPQPAYGGRLSINTRPWSTVYLGKRLLGSTPLADIPVPRGALNLKLVDRDGNVHIRRVAPAKSASRAISYEF